MPESAWTCETCGEQHASQFETCWKCEGARLPPEEREGQIEIAAPPSEPLKCLRCTSVMKKTGTMQIQDHSSWDISLFRDFKSFDVFVCPRCGKAEFFVDGLGEELRPR